jgi:predicted metal-dependent hydrolase
MTRNARLADPAQLDLFGAAAPADDNARRPPRAPRRTADPAREVPPSNGSPSPVYSHPQAQRQIRLGEHLVAYRLRRARRRSIGFIVDIDGLSVAAPRWVTLADIEEALLEKGSWILRKLAEQQQRAQRQQAARVEWRDGTSIPFLGETVIVVIDPRVDGAILNADAVALPGVPKLMLHVGLPQSASAEQIRDAVQSWLQRQAIRVFEERCAHFACRLNVRVKRLALSSAQTRWGSANANGSVRLNWRLIHFAMPIIDYVVAHELAHLRVMDHSPKFWDVVRSVMPDYEGARGLLRDDALPALD